MQPVRGGTGGNENQFPRHLPRSQVLGQVTHGGDINMKGGGKGPRRSCQWLCSFLRPLRAFSSSPAVWCLSQLRLLIYGVHRPWPPGLCPLVNFLLVSLLLSGASSLPLGRGPAREVTLPASGLLSGGPAASDWLRPTDGISSESASIDGLGEG